MDNEATKACTTVQPTANCFAGPAYVYTATPAKHDYGRAHLSTVFTNTCMKPLKCTSIIDE
eukprot:3379585-Pleurochrysis_carterae.AAC.1